MLVYHWLLAFVDYGLFMCCYVSLCIMYTWLVIISISVTIVIISRIVSISVIRQGDRAPRTRGTLNLPGGTACLTLLVCLRDIYYKHM